MGETLLVSLVLGGAVVSFGRQWLRFAFDDFVVLFESSVMVVYLVNSDLLSTNLLLQINVRLIHVNP